MVGMGKLELITMYVGDKEGEKNYTYQSGVSVVSSTLDKIKVGKMMIMMI